MESGLGEEIDKVHAVACALKGFISRLGGWQIVAITLKLLVEGSLTPGNQMTSLNTQ